MESKLESVSSKVEVDMEAVPPDDSDSAGILLLLKQLFKNTNINLPKLTDLLIEQNYVGCILKQQLSLEAVDEEDDDESVYAFTTVVNLTARKGKECVSQVISFFKELCGTGTEAAKFRMKELLDKSANDLVRLGLVIHERIVNIPPVISVPMLESLQKDMVAATAKGMRYDFSHYIFISKMFRLPKPESTEISVYPEDTVWERLGNKVFQFDYELTGEVEEIFYVDQKNEEHHGTPFRRLHVIAAEDFNNLLEELKHFD